MLLLFLLALSGPARADTPSPTPTPPPAARFPYTYTEDGVEIRVPNLEVTPDRRNVLVHAYLTNNNAQPSSIYWQHYFTVINSKGESVRPASDCGEDFGNGLVHTMGIFSIPAGKKVRVMIYFPIEPDEVPIRLQFSDGAITRESYSR